MLTTLATVKARLVIPEIDTQYNAILTNAIAGFSARFDTETNRTLARTVAATHEFPSDETEICLPCYPVESVTRFDLKTTETEGWLEQTSVDFLIRSRCVLSLSRL